MVRLGFKATTAVLPLLLLALLAPPATADFATGGAGRFLGAIDWFSWGAPGTALPNTGFSRTQSRTVGDQTIAVTCSVSGITSDAAGTNLTAYRPGSWRGDGFDDMYNTGGTGGANQLVVGLSTSGRTVTFDFACSATLNGTPFPLGGLVLADAEQMSSAGNEFIEATIAPTATWRVIDRYRTAGCTGNTELTRTAGGTLRFGRSTTECAAGPAVVGFMEDAASARVRFRGGGTTAIALGVVLSFDRGDAPAGYGDAVHLEQYGFSGGTVPTDAVIGSHSPTLQLGAPAQPPVRLGATVDPEDTALAGPTATGDDTSGNGVFGPPDDEDAIADPDRIEVVAGGTHTLAGVACSGTATVAGWVDWNRDGVFGAAERSAPVACDGSVDLVWTVPADVRPALDAPTYLRLRIASTASELASASGVALSGEAEDYALRVAVPTIAVTKSLPERAEGDDQFAVVLSRGDALARATTAGSGTSATTGAVVVEPGGGYRIADVPVSADLADYVPSIACADASGAQVAVTGSAPEWTLPALDADDQVSCTVTNTLARPSVLLTKSASAIADLDGNGPDAGDEVEYSFTVTNTGNVVLDPVVVSDPTAGPVTCPPGPLAPGRSVACGPVAHTLTQAEVNAGTLVNTATATGTPPSGRPVTSTDSTTTAIPVRRALDLVKSAGELVDLDGNGPDAGDTVVFSFRVTNTGNVPLDPVVVDDPVVGPVACPTGPLVPGDSFDCASVTRALTQAEIDAGALRNTATATGTAPDGGIATSTDHTSTMVVAAPSVSLAKSPSAVFDVDGNGPDAGDTVTYAFLVTNTGNVTLDPITVTDSRVGPVTCAPGPLAPAETRECAAAPYTVTQADVDAGEVENSAEARGTSPSGQVVTATDTVTTPVAATPSIGLVKTASAVSDVDGNGHDAGDTIGYAFTVTNTGTVTLTSVTVTDDRLGVVSCPAGPLAPGASVECTAGAYALKQKDVDAGKVDNQATASGLPPSLVPVIASDTASVAVVRTPSIGLVKAAGPITDTDANGPDAGDTVTYAFTVTNTGNVTLNPVTVSDARLDPVTCPPGPLAPGASIDCTAAPHTLTQADVDTGRLPNTATATGVSPAGPVTADDSDVVAIPTIRDIALDKTADPVVDTDANGPDAGDTITFAFRVTNTGNVTLDPIAVTDPLAGEVTCPPGPLTPGASVDCTAAPYPLTQPDVDAAEVRNTATATGTDPFGEQVSATDSTRTLINPEGAITLTKTPDAPDAPSAGDTVSYRLTVTNSGAVTLRDITVTDPLLGEVTCPATPLAPGASMDCTAAPYTLTQADLDAGKVDNTAVAAGVTPTGQGVADSASATVTLTPRAALTLRKTATLHNTNADPKANPGEVITYTFTVTNTGAVTLTAITITDPILTTPATCPPTPLAPGESTTCTARHTIRPTDITNGKVTNTATATGQTPNGTPTTSPPATAVVPAALPTPPTPKPDPTPKPEPTPKPVPDLPATGASTTPALALGTLLLAAGAVTLIATRRRRR